MTGLSFSEHRRMGIVRRGGKETWGQDVKKKGKKGRKEGGIGGRERKMLFLDNIDTVSSFVSIIFATIKKFSREKQLLVLSTATRGTRSYILYAAAPSYRREFSSVEHTTQL